MAMYSSSRSARRTIATWRRRYWRLWTINMLRARARCATAERLAIGRMARRSRQAFHDTPTRPSLRRSPAASTSTHAMAVYQGRTAHCAPSWPTRPITWMPISTESFTVLKSWVKSSLEPPATIEKWAFLAALLNWRNTQPTQHHLESNNGHDGEENQAQRFVAQASHQASHQTGPQKCSQENSWRHRSSYKWRNIPTRKVNARASSRRYAYHEIAGRGGDF